MVVEGIIGKIDVVFEVSKAKDRLYVCLQLAFNIVNPDSDRAMSHGVNEACMHPPRYSDSVSPVATGGTHDGFSSCRISVYTGLLSE